MPRTISYDRKNDYIYVTDESAKSIIKTKIDGTGWTELAYWNAPYPYKLNWFPQSMVYDSYDGYIYVMNGYYWDPGIIKIDGNRWMDITGWTKIFSGNVSRLDVSTIEEGYVASGIFTSSIHDAGSIADWLKIQWEGQTPVDTQIKLQTRTGNSAVPDSNWSGWSDYYLNSSGEDIKSPRARYIQYKAILSTKNEMITPVLSEVNIQKFAETHTLSYWSVDNVGNIEDPKYSIFVLTTLAPPDTVSPAVITDLKAMSLEKHIVTLEWTAPGDDGIYGEIKDGKYWIKYSSYLVNGLIASTDIILSTNTSPGNSEIIKVTGLKSATSYYFMIKTADEMVNWSDWSNITSAYILTIDTTPPISQIEISKPQTIIDDNVFISSLTLLNIKSYDPFIDDFASGVSYSEYVIDKETREIYFTGFTVSEGIRTIDYRSIDKFENFEIVKSTIVYVDSTSPLSELKISSPVYINPITNVTYVSSMSKISISAEDIISNEVKSGIDKTIYQIDIDSTTVYTKGFYLISEGIHTVKYYSIDKVNNVESVKEMFIYVDTTPPISLIEVLGIKYFDGVNLFLSSSSKFNIYSEDTVAGLKYSEYKIDTGDWQKYIEPFYIDSEGIHKIYYRGIDNVDNYEDFKIFNVIIDTTAPEIKISSPVGDEKFVATQDKINISYSVTDLGPFSATGYLKLIDSPDKTKIGLSTAVVSGQIIEPLNLPYYGFYKLIVEAEDWAGHKSSAASGAFEVIWDVQPPRTEILISSGMKYITEISTFVTHDTEF
ncbi:MAG: hypothetical protein AB1633_09655, partial [Elusimicrobiota bacterium]